MLLERKRITIEHSFTCYYTFKRLFMKIAILRFGCWLLEMYAFATSKVISGWVLTCDNAHPLWLYSVAYWETQSHYPDAELIPPSHQTSLHYVRLKGPRLCANFVNIVWTSWMDYERPDGLGHPELWTSSKLSGSHPILSPFWRT